MLSHHHKTIFVHIPKTAGQSIANAFLADLGLDWASRTPLLLMPNDLPKAGPPRLTHMTALDYIEKKYVPREMFDAYYSFSIVRNPYARVVSMYRFMNYYVSFNRFVLDLLGGKLWTEMHYFVRPQIDFLTDRDGHVLVKDIFRLEHLDDDFAKISARSHLTTPLGRVNTSKTSNPNLGYRGRLAGVRTALRAKQVSDIPLYLGAKDTHANWRDYYDLETRAQVEALYGADIEKFDYSFDA